MSAKWREAALTRPTRAVADGLRRSGAHSHFVLVGGTALALQLGHRFSQDLDFFSGSEALDAAGREKILGSLAAVGRVEITHQKDGWLQLFVSEIPVTFLKYPYPWLEEPLDWRGIAVASIPDIAVMKINAIIGRGTRRDFLDLYAICQDGGLRELLRRCGEKYPDQRDFLVQASYALVYFDDAEKDRMPRLIRSYDWDKIKEFFQREAPKALGNLLESR
ncbi:MAG: nucleotidyl transferase AbiEii/AbiGii toxin family protein [Elusimicrobia bacterium]|nr:nucleotidyl transferase AbiEii/AbiGii toxin family protein [Elusimicrobiota bacterium]